MSRFYCKIYIPEHQCGVFIYLRRANVFCFTDISVFHSQIRFIVILTHCIVLDVKVLLHDVHTWPSVWVLLSTVSGHFTSGSDYGLNINLASLPHCVTGMSFGSSLSKSTARCMSAMLPFLDTHYRVLSSIAAHGNENFII